VKENNWIGAKMLNESGEKNVSVKMNEDFIKRLDDIAHLVKLNRNQIIRNILEIGVEEIEKLRFVGILQLSLIIRDLRESILGKCNLKATDPVAGDKPIPIKLQNEFIARLDSLAEKGGLSRHQLIKNILRVGVEEGESMAKYGIIKLGLLLRDLPESFRVFFKKGDEAYKASEKIK